MNRRTAPGERASADGVLAVVTTLVALAAIGAAVVGVWFIVTH